MPTSQHGPPGPIPALGDEDRADTLAPLASTTRCSTKLEAPFQAPLIDPIASEPPAQPPQPVQGSGLVGAAPALPVHPCCLSQPRQLGEEQSTDMALSSCGRVGAAAGGQPLRSARTSAENNC